MGDTEEKRHEMSEKKTKTIASVIDDLNFTTERMSGKIWATSVAVLAFSTTIILKFGSDNNSTYFEIYDFVGPILLCIFAVLFDLAQYLCGYYNSKAVLSRLENTSSERGYSAQDRLWKIRNGLFIHKVFLCFIGTFWLGAVVAYRFVEVWSGIG